MLISLPDNNYKKLVNMTLASFPIFKSSVASDMSYLLNLAMERDPPLLSGNVVTETYVQGPVILC